MGLIAHWPLNESSGDAIDVTGNGNDGTVNGATQGATGILGESAYDFDGTDDNIDFGSEMTFTNDYWSVTGWFNTNTTSGPHNFIGVSSSNTDSHGSEYICINDSNLSFWDNGSGVWRYGNTNISTGSWYHFGFICLNDSIIMYLNSKNDGSGALSTSYNNLITRFIGESNGNRHFDGRIADVRIYNHALTPNEVAYLYEVPQRQQYISNTLTS